MKCLPGPVIRTILLFWWGYSRPRLQLRLDYESTASLLERQFSDSLEATLFPDVKASCWPDCTLSPNWHSGVWCGHQTSPTSQAGGFSVADPWIDSRSTEARQRAYQRCAGRVLSGRVSCKGQDALGSAGPKQCDPGA